ncbi:DL-endopeptidase inhibitor IseA family protein [Paenibacillus thalictri]|uniref:DL-endopeptidase inhibitor IseA family protein n=1 Tax=Paenibacillus thalictri TaxID=2527873 RepID=UPI0013EF4A0F|nr:DL-endopeptidase inhibitor IseA family protein [Paenibacillus thalictri]
MVRINLKSFISGVAVGAVFFSSISFAAPAVVKLIVNGKEVQSEVPAQIIDGNTMVPARGLAEALGAKVEWDSSSRTVTVTKLASPTPFSELDAAQLAASAKNHYWHVSGGGQGEGLVQSFTVKGMEYRWLGSDIETKAKLLAYLEETYTPEQVSAYWNKQTDNSILLEINGRLAQPNADGGGSLNWAEAKATLVKDSTDKKTFKLNVPFYDVDHTHEEIEVQYRFIPGYGWRIDGTVDSIK